MKINLKKKVMLAVMAGGMLCMGSALAATYWSGDPANETSWQSLNYVGFDGRTSGANLTIDSSTCVGGNYVYELTTGDQIDGGHRQNGGVTVTGNSITFDTSNITVIQAKIYGGYSPNCDVTNNSVTINGGNFNGGMLAYIYGGYAGNHAATGNIVTINGGIFTNGFNLIGGMGSTSSGNILNINTKIEGRAGGVDYFQTINFTLPADIEAGQTMLSTSNIRFQSTSINVDATLATNLNDGDVITLIESTNAPNGVWTAGTVTGAEGTITLDGNNIIFTVTGGGGGNGNNDRQKAPVEGIAAAVQIVNQSADLASGQGMASLVAETAGGLTNTFGALTAGQSKYKTGSHVDVDGWGFLVGGGKTKEWKDGSATTYGLFFEYGKGDFDTYNGNVHGDGNSENKGVGIMARHKLTNNTYYEGNIRFGKQETEWGESELGSYDTDSRYYGIMLGVGHVYPVGKNEIDVYGRYTYGHVGACDATLKDSEYHFDSVKSHRVRVGGKYNFKLKDSNAKPFIGLAWEHEFKGEARASIAGVGEAPAPSMKGHTGIMEVGCDWDVSKKWTVGLGTNAYMGKRKGWDGMARVFYNF